MDWKYLHNDPNILGGKTVVVKGHRIRPISIANACARMGKEGVMDMWELSLDQINECLEYIQATKDISEKMP